MVPINGVLTIEVLLYRTAYCGPSGVLIIEVHCIAYIHIIWVVCNTGLFMAASHVGNSTKLFNTVHAEGNEALFILCILDSTSYCINHAVQDYIILKRLQYITSHVYMQCRGMHMYVHMARQS